MMPLCCDPPAMIHGLAETAGSLCEKIPNVEISCVFCNGPLSFVQSVRRWEEFCNDLRAESARKWMYGGRARDVEDRAGKRYVEINVTEQGALSSAVAAVDSDRREPSSPTARR